MNRFGPTLATVASIAATAALALPTGAAASSSPHAHGAGSGKRQAASSCTRSQGAHRAAGKRCTRTSRTSRRRATRTVRPARSAPALAAAPAVAGEAVSAQAAIAKVLATPCQNTDLTPEASNLPLVRAAVLCLINTERAQNGRAPLQPNAQLEAAAASHGQEMIADDYFDHVSPSGETPVERVRQTGYIPSSEVGYVIGENLAWGTLSLSTPEAIVKAWIASPEHLANILEAKYEETGIDVEPEVPSSLAEGVQGALYTQEFGVIIH